MHRRFALLACALLLLAIPSAAADGGGAEDAGDSADAAMPVPLGTLAGTVDERDREDWYRVALPSGEGLRATLTGEPGADLWVELVSPTSGRVLDDDMTDSPAYPVTLLAGDASGEVLVRVAARITGEGTMGYTLRLASTPMPDFVVTRLHVESHEAQTRLGAAPFAWTHTITIDVVNAGPIAGSGYASVSARATSTTPSSNWIGGRALSLEPGEGATLVATWNSSGYVGDIEIAGFARASYATGDLDHENGERSTTVVAYASGAGSGFTVTPSWITCSGWARADHTCWHTESLANGFGVWTHTRQGDVVLVVDGGVTTDGATLSVCTKVGEPSYECPSRFRHVVG